MTEETRKLYDEMVVVDPYIENDSTENEEDPLICCFCVDSSGWHSMD